MAIESQLGDLPDYGHRMNVIVNVIRSVMANEVVEQVMEVTGLPFTELNHLVIGLELLVKDFVGIIEGMPKNVKDTIHSKMGCGHCSACRAAKRATGTPQKEETSLAIEKLIATMTGGKQHN